MKKKEEKNYARRYAHEYHFLRAFFQFFAISISYPYFKIYYNFKPEGKENIPKSGRYIFAPNHISMFDPLFVSCTILRPMVYMAKKELFEKGHNLEWWVKKLGAFSVNRQKPELATFKTLKEVFKTGWPLVIFPEGGIRDFKRIENVYKGFATIAKNFEADIIPISIGGFEGYKKKPFEQTVRVKVCPPISHKQSEEEIIKQWAKQICDETGFENLVITGDEAEKIPESVG